MSVRIIAKLFHAFFCQPGNEPLIHRRDYRLPADGGSDVKCSLLFASDTTAVMLIRSLFFGLFSDQPSDGRFLQKIVKLPTKTFESA